MAVLDRIKAYPENDYFVLTKVAENEIEPSNVVQAGTNEGEVDVAGADTNPIGVAGRRTVGDDDETHAAGDAVQLITDGVVRLVASGAISEGDRVATDANGQIKTLNEGTTPEDAAVGRALTEAGSSGDVVEVALNL